MKCRALQRAGRHRRPPSQRRRSAPTASCTTAASRCARPSTHFDMIPGERVLVAISGGKDSLALWDILPTWVTTPTASTSGSASASTATSRRFAERFADAAGLQAASTSTSRPSTASPSPTRLAGHETRAVFGVRPVEAPPVQPGRARRRLRRLATGHNLDDEAAVLFGNVMQWHDRAISPGSDPVLPGAPGFARRVKPLVRLGERETAAYCVLNGIDYIVDECPMAAGNRHFATRRRSTRSRSAPPAPRRRSTSSSWSRCCRCSRRRRRGARPRRHVRSLRRTQQCRDLRVLQAGRTRDRP